MHEIHVQWQHPASRHWHRHGSLSKLMIWRWYGKSQTLMWVFTYFPRISGESTLASVIWIRFIRRHVPFELTGIALCIFIRKMHLSSCCSCCSCCVVNNCWEKGMPTLSMCSSTSCWEQLSIFCSTFLTDASTSTMLSLVMLRETVSKVVSKQITLRAIICVGGRVSEKNIPLNNSWHLQRHNLTETAMV